jgi:NAD(P)-dependent dehydrogenase (short-subunit alcohol dehydrogenase family)
MMNRSFEDKTVVISGAGRDFGRTLAILFARAGATVYLSARNLQAASETADFITRQAGRAFAAECDVSDSVQVAAWAHGVAENTGHIDYLFLNAGRWVDAPNLDDLSFAEIGDTIASSLTGALMMTKAFLPLLRGSAAADIVAMVSSCGLPNYTQSPANPAFYAAKHGLSGFCDIMTERLAPEGIRVWGIYPTDFDNIDPDSPAWEANKSPDGLLTSRSIWESIATALAQPRECQSGKIILSGLRWDQVEDDTDHS